MGKTNFIINLAERAGLFAQMGGKMHIRPRPFKIDPKGLKLARLENDTVQFSKNIASQTAYKLKHNGCSLILTDAAGNRLSTALFMEDGANSLTILELSSHIQGREHGTRLLNAIKETYPDHNISLAACWERGLGHKPPHAFYMRNGFVPENKTAREVLTKWLNNGAKTSDFPMEYEICDMIFKPHG